MTFKTKYNCDCNKKQPHIETCIQTFLYFERSAFEFHDFGLGVNYVHFPVNVPKWYYVKYAEIMLNSYIVKNIFEMNLGFRRRYLRGRFWIWYENHDLTGM